MTPTTTPPAAMLSRKFFSEGEIPGPAASATSGMTMDAVSAAAVNPTTAFSFSEALASNFLVGKAFEELTDNGLKKASELRSCFWVAKASGVDAKTAVVDAI
ncbi:Rpa1ap [Sarracenia purpurea var. burkii]